MPIILIAFDTLLLMIISVLNILTWRMSVHKKVKLKKFSLGHFFNRKFWYKRSLQQAGPFSPSLVNMHVSIMKFVLSFWARLLLKELEIRI